MTTSSGGDQPPGQGPTHADSSGAQIDSSQLGQSVQAAIKGGVPGIPPKFPLQISPLSTLSEPLVIRLRQPNGTPAAGVSIKTRNGQGEVTASFRVDQSGEIVLPAGTETPASFDVEIGAGVHVQVKPSDLSLGVVVADVPPTPGQVTFFGQVAKPSGDPAEGIGLSIQRSDGVTVALTVSDPNGVWFLSTRETEPHTFTYQLFTTGTANPVVLPDLASLAASLSGPMTIVLTKPPTSIAGVAPASALLTVDNGTAEQALRLAPQLFSRGRSTMATSPCNPYTPADAAAEVFTVTRLGMFPPSGGTQTITTPIAPVAPVNFRAAAGNEPAGLRYGLMFTLEQSWRSLGTVLGDLVHSIPLAPCEQVKVATVDWTSQQRAFRQSSVQESDLSDTTLTRNRTVSEAVRLSSQKHVSGIQGGGGASLSIGPFSIGAGAAGSFTNALTTAAAHSTQTLHDNIRQASSVLRNTRAASVAEVSESEQSKVSTRTLRNNNHCHTITYQYFEVLQRYLVTTAVVGVDPVVYVPFQIVDWTADLVSQYAYTLRRALLDPTLLSVIDEILDGRLEFLPGASITALQKAIDLVNGIVGTAQTNLLFGGNDVVALAQKAAQDIGAAIQQILAQQSASSDIQRLLGHLNANTLYYTASIIRAGDPLLCWTILDNVIDEFGNALADVTEDSQVLGVVGGYLGFRLSDFRWIPPEVTAGLGPGWLDPANYAAASDDALMTLPTPGVFAESQLGNCSSCETVDDTLFWDWQKSPCSDQAPDITSAELASRFQGMKDVLDFVKPTLIPGLITVPSEPSPIGISDSTLGELVKNLDMTDPKTVLDFVSQLAQLAQKSDSGPSSGAPVTGTSSGAAGAAGGTGVSSGATGTTSAGTAAGTGGASALGDWVLPASSAVAFA